MMNSKKQSNYIVLALALSATLAGCGGGDSGKGTSSLPAADPIANYLGGIVGACHQDSDVKSGASMLYTQWTLTAPVKVSSTKATYSARLSVYTSSECNGTPLATTTVSKTQPSSFEVVGSKKIGDLTVDKIVNTQGVLFAGISAKTLTVNNVTYSGDYLSAVPTSVKDIASWQGNDLYLGDTDEALDADGYATDLMTTPSASTVH